MNIWREQVYRAVDAERNYQERKWQNPRHEIMAYIPLLQHYLDKMSDACCECDDTWRTEALIALRKLTALGVAAMEEHGVVERQ